jgi:hypothetical protein
VKGVTEENFRGGGGCAALSAGGAGDEGAADTVTVAEAGELVLAAGVEDAGAGRGAGCAAKVVLAVALTPTARNQRSAHRYPPRFPTIMRQPTGSQEGGRDDRDDRLEMTALYRRDPQAREVDHRAIELRLKDGPRAEVLDEGLRRVVHLLPPPEGVPDARRVDRVGREPDPVVAVLAVRAAPPGTFCCCISEVIAGGTPMAPQYWW